MSPSSRGICFAKIQKGLADIDIGKRKTTSSLVWKPCESSRFGCSSLVFRRYALAISFLGEESGNGSLQSPHIITRTGKRSEKHLMSVMLS
jgi:hypothetical protein